MQTPAEIAPSRLWEYSLVANPDGNVCKKVMEVREEFRETYMYKRPGENEPHIVIANFVATESMEETLIRWMQRICSQHKGFPVTLNNYSGFPAHSIYIRVQDHEPFRQLATQLRVIDEYVTSNSCPPVRLLFRPHIAIATGLESNVYEKAMLDYSHRTFHESFNLSGLVLLKKSNPFDNCKQVNVFRFYPPDTNMYGEVA